MKNNQNYGSSKAFAATAADKWAVYLLKNVNPAAGQNKRKHHIYRYSKNIVLKSPAGYAAAAFTGLQS